ncbi:MAG TPA: hypothetical protein EYQ68_05395 [Cytophagales bacterium]|nr:hypothetical protein [Cytophagales bacterium]
MNLAEKLLNYKHKVAGKYLPVRSDQICKRVFEMDKYYVSTKIDGNICFINKDVDGISIVSHNNNSFKRPELEKECSEILKNKCGLFVGEIYLHDENKRTRSYDLKREIGNNKSDIRIALFDIISFENKDYKENEWNEKKKILSDNFKSDGKIYFLNEIELSSRKDIEETFNKTIVESNEEGLVVRGENGPVFKIKEYHSFDMVILGYVNGYTNNLSLMKEILVGAMTEENKFLTIGVIANGFDIDQREKLSKDFEKIRVDYDSIIVSGAKIPFTMIKPKYIVEIESTDIINSNSDGLINRPLINFKKNYFFQKNSNSVSLTTPVFKNFRDDKKVNLNDVGINQITRVIEIPDEITNSIIKPQSELINRDVYTKMMKGATNVRKFLVWNTKSKDDSYPKYVYYKIDYSPTRKIKIKRDIKISNSKKQIINLFKNEIESDIKSGWNKV